MLQRNYKELLSRAYAELPSTSLEHKRFEIPRAIVLTIGMRTVFQNIREIGSALNRNPHHILKCLSKEMATSVTIDENRAIFQGKFFQDTINRLIKRYTEEFVICPICKRPDTKIVKEKRLYFLVCEACGARSSIRPP
jgi:translation initiation factor 2 subunit 2